MIDTTPRQFCYRSPTPFGGLPGGPGAADRLTGSPFEGPFTRASA